MVEVFVNFFHNNCLFSDSFIPIHCVHIFMVKFFLCPIEKCYMSNNRPKYLYIGSIVIPFGNNCTVKSIRIILEL